MVKQIKSTVKKVRNAAIGDFDDQIWPINCVILILAGFVAGIIIATSRFDDPRLLHNAWFRLATVILAVGVLFWAVVWLQGKMVRRVQLCVLISLLMHLWLGMYLHERYMVLVARREAETAQREAREFEDISMPEYHWEHIEKPEQTPDIRKPLPTETPKPTEPDPVKQEENDSLPTEKKPIAEPEPPSRQQPNPAELRRAELSAPRRAPRAAGAEISRQEWKHRPMPNEPIPQTKPVPRPNENQSPAVVGDRVPAVERQQTKPSTLQRRTFQSTPTADRQLEAMRLARRATQNQPLADAPTTPKPTRQLIRPAEIPRTEAAAPRPVETVQKPQRQLDSNTPALAHRRPDTPQPRKQTTEPAPTEPRPVTRSVASQRRADERPELAQSPRALAEHRPRELSLPTDLSSSEPRIAAATPDRRSQLAPAEASTKMTRRTSSTVSPSRTQTQAPEPQRSATPTLAAANRSRRSESQPTLQSQMNEPSRSASRADALAQASAAVVQQPSLAQSTPTSEPVGSSVTAPGATALAKAADTSLNAARQPDAGASLPAMSSAARLPSSLARRAVASQREPSGSEASPSRPSTLARAAGGISLPSAMISSDSRPAMPAASGSSPASQLETTGSTAVARSPARAPSGSQTAAAGVAKLAVGSTQVVARSGQPRATGSDRPSVASNSPVPRIARAATAGSSLAAMPGPAIAPAPSVAASPSGAGGPNLPVAAPQATSVTRGGSRAPITARPNTGSGPAGSSGAPGTIGIAQAARITRYESVPSELSGGGIPVPGRTPGRALAPEATADMPQMAATAPSGGKSAASPLKAQPGGQLRQVAGLPGSLQSQTAAGAIASMSALGSPLPAAAARRATASQRDGSGPDLSPGAAATPAKASTGINLPTAAVPVENALAPGAGGVAVAKGAAASKLEPGDSVTIQRTATSGAPAGARTAARGTAEFSLGSAQVIALAGRLRAGDDGLPTLAAAAPGSAVGRASGQMPAMSGLAGNLPQPATAMANGSGPSGGSNAAASAAANASATAAARTGSVALPGGGPAGQTGSIAGGSAGALGATKLSRATGSRTEPTQLAGSGMTGPARTMGRMPTARLVGEVPEMAAAAPGSGTSEAMPSSAPSAAPAARTGSVARQSQAAGLPGDLVARTPVDGAVESGPSATTPGVTAGARRLPPGDGQGPSLAAEVGAGPLAKTNMPGLPRGLAETIDQRPTAASGQATAEPHLLEVAAGMGIGEPGRVEGGLPVQIAAAVGQGGLSHELSPEVGIPSRRARPESDVIHAVASRFVIERSGGELAVDGQIREPTEAFSNRDPGRRAEMAKLHGGTEGTEKAVEMGLDFFARHQFPDGHWSLHELPDNLPNNGEGYEDVALAQMQSDTAATGLALLSYLGAGYTHLDDKHRAVVRRGLDWMVRNQKVDGDTFSGGTPYAWYYSHGIAAIALCEAYGMTRDPELRQPAQRSIQFILDSQHPTEGGWRYKPQAESDTSVSGWQLMAMKSAQMAGLEVPAGSLAQLSKWLDKAQAQGGSRYTYNPNADDTPEQRDGLHPNLAMTAEGLLMRMYQGWRRDNPALVEGAEYLKSNLPEVGTEARPLRNVYYWYYATQVMFQMQGDYWTAWNEKMQPLLQKSQTDTGPLAGSWHPAAPVRDRWGHAGGRHYVTAMNLLMLEVYYRHLPLFQLDFKAKPQTSK